ncbi:MAG: hypothetical protein KGJ78_02580 [Alphaproteobacteria bacterium]|nr:hypothetical protein [Alphaproteobacteria bacterium]
MPGLFYETADVLVFDPVAGNRTATRAALYTLGFRCIETVATLEDLAAVLARTPPDLAVCEAQGSEARLCEVIQSMRQGLMGYNPFVVIMVTAWDKTTTLVKRILDSGADDLLLRPFSTTLLGIRIETHIERRKGFVVTHNYVGPDRRSDPRRASNVKLFEPPNSLRMRTKERMNTEESASRLEIQLKAARETLAREKVRRDAFQIGVLWRLLEDGIPDDDGRAVDPAKLGHIAKQIVARDYEGKPAEATRWCESVLAGVEGLDKGVDRDASLHLLGHAAVSLSQALQPEMSSEEYVRQLNEVVAMIRARGAAEAASKAARKASRPAG